jgi:LPXTG-site transpeptidase (sortase) family protein
MHKDKKKIFSLLVVTISLLITVIIYVKISVDDYKSTFELEQGNQATSVPIDITENKNEKDIEISPVVGNLHTDESLEVDNNSNNEIDSISNNEDLPYDKLFITPERQSYESGDLKLIIPKLDFKEGVENGTDTESLNLGPGLYEYAQLPGDGNRNASIAAHRNTSRNGKIGVWFFYYIDTLTTGDYLYLVDDSNIYQYEYEKTTVVDPYDWGPIYSQGYSCLTLTSCEPIGISTHRIIVLSKLINTYPYSDTFDYVSNN